MEASEIRKLKFRRQYIIAPRNIECPFMNNVKEIGDRYKLYTHIDLSVTEYEKDGVKVNLLGDMFDYENCKKNNGDILKDLITDNFEIFTEKTANYSGRYILIYQKDNELKFLHDATATRKIYYANTGNGLWFASQPYLLAKILNLKETTAPSKLAFYNSKTFELLYNSNIGDTTRYDEIQQLLPNHYLNVNEFKIVRYWPNKKINYQSLSSVAEICAKMIKGYVKSIATRYEIMLPLTAGKDSRTLLAATYDFKDDVYYYVNRYHGLNEDNNDIFIPRKLLTMLKLKLNILKPNNITVDEDFEKAYYENHKFASSSYLPFIYNYYVNFSHKVNLPGNIASAGFEIYKDSKMMVSAENLAELNNVSQFQYAKDYYANWLSNCKDLCHINNINILNLFYWEERLANWGTQIQLEKDIAQEEFNPFNSRQLISLYLSVKPKYIELPNFILHKKVIKNLWPELLKVPINPGLKNNIRKIFQFLGILKLFYRWKYSKLN